MGDAVQANLVRRAQDGETEAFAALIGLFERVVLSVAYAVTGDAGAAGDVAQDTFFRAWQRLGDLKEPEKFASWLCGITRNLAIDVSRARTIRSSRLSNDADANGVAAPGGNPLDELGRREERDRVTAAIGRLDEISRTAVVMRYYENMPSKKIAELLGLTPAAIDVRLMRARRELREHLDRATQNVAGGRDGSEGAL